MKIKNILLASMIAGASLFGSAAFAANVGQTVSINLDSDGVGGYNAHFGNTYGAADRTNTFTDKYMFVLNSNFDSSTSLTSSYLASSTVKDLQITSFNLVKYDPMTSAVLGTYAGSNVTGGGAHPTDRWELTATGLSAGSYFVQVDGLVAGTGGGAYGSDLTIAVSAVPEPATYGMMAAGLGLLGFVARRKQAKKA
ncbi:PEP-CTERM sorting domain-containing protein [Oxalobacteraceae bacterium OTU3REALA1]|nr:PEP-CTERM sorting domain-containing protein [Oxalobacteraceae bacterium OTU3REALA1]